MERRAEGPKNPDTVHQRKAAERDGSTKANATWKRPKITRPGFILQEKRQSLKKKTKGTSYKTRTITTQTHIKRQREKTKHRGAAWMR